MAYNKISRYQTFVRKPNEDKSDCTVKYHQTEIVRTFVAHGRVAVTLDHNGWKGVTTKRKMNQAACEFDLPFSVYQSKGEWYVTTKAGTYEFEDRQFTFDMETGMPWAIVELFTERAAA